MGSPEDIGAVVLGDGDTFDNGGIETVQDEPAPEVHYPSDERPSHRDESMSEASRAEGDRVFGHPEQSKQLEEDQQAGDEDSWQAGRIIDAQERLRDGPPNDEGVNDAETQAYLDRYETQQNEALEHFRSEPVEGPDNRPRDTERTRPWVHCREGDRPVDPGDLTRRDDVVYYLSDSKGAGHPPSGLAGSDAVPHPSHTAEERAARIEEGRARAAEVVGKPNWSNAKYAGEVFYDKLTPELKERFPDGVQFTYEGFPDFSRYAVKTVQFEDGFVPPKSDGKPDRQGDNKRANAIFGWSEDPEGFTWHHVEDSRTMHLVDYDLHNVVRHWGGISIGKRHEKRNTDA